MFSLTYKCTVGEEFDIMFIAELNHLHCRPGVDERELPSLAHVMQGSGEKHIPVLD